MAGCVRLGSADRSLTGVETVAKTKQKLSPSDNPSPLLPHEWIIANSVMQEPR